MKTDVEAGIGKLDELAKAIDKYKTTVYVLNCVGYIQEAQITSSQFGTFIHVYLLKAPNVYSYRHHLALTMESAFKVIGEWLPDALMYTSSLTLITNEDLKAKEDRKVEPHEELYKITLAAWMHAIPKFEESTPDDLRPRESIVKKHLLPKLREGASGVTQWNDVPHEVRKAVNWQGTNLESAQLEGIVLRNLDFRDAVFTGANLNGAELYNAILSNATICGAALNKADLRHVTAIQTNFEGAQLCRADLEGAVLTGAGLNNADLSSANLSYCDLRDCDLSSANLTGTNLTSAIFDEKTKFPDDVPILSLTKLNWKGKGTNPVKVALKDSLGNMNVDTFEDFMEQMKGQFEKQRLDKVMKMLKKEKFQLFSEVSSSKISGVVKSQTDKDLVYACQLTEEGSFTCCTQNLKPCGGLRGALCKHLLVLLIGLTKADQMKPSDAASWALASMLSPPKIEKDALAQIFLKYKGYVAGEVDWRPTETIPEDYYAF